MSVGVFLAVLGAALLHAAWNALIKHGASKLGGMVIFSLLSGGIGLPVVLMRPVPQADVWPWLAASVLIHVAYKLFLALAYEQGDLSRVYPISRGAAPLIVLVVSIPLLADPLSAPEVLGILLMGGGILTMARGVIRNGESRRLLPFAMGAACATAAYTLVDGIGARASGDALAYVAWLFVLDGILFSSLALMIWGRGVVPANGRAWQMGALAAGASVAAYAIAVWAMTVAPIALVAALRESSILFAVLIGWLVFGERLRPEKAVAVALIVAGVVVTRV